MSDILVGFPMIVEFEAVCAVCGSVLTAKQASVNTDRPQQLKVEPCEYCLTDCRAKLAAQHEGESK